MNAVSAYEGEGNSVIYTMSNGSEQRYIGGSRSWRNNNSGNIRDGSFTKNRGSIGAAGGFAVFPNYETGKNALISLLGHRNYQSLTLGEAIARYAPASENNTETYIRHIEQALNCSRDTPMSNINLNALAEVIEKHEGWSEGTIKKENLEGTYIWRTQKDEKVRSSHADREGKVFYFDNPPEGGNPGDAYGCRCYAEKTKDPLNEDVTKWSNNDLKAIMGRNDYWSNQELNNKVANYYKNKY